MHPCVVVLAGKFSERVTKSRVDFFAKLLFSESKFGAIGEKPPKKTFNQYAAYDRETNDLFSSMRDQSRNIANLSPMSNPVNPAFAVPTPPNKYDFC